MNENRKPAIGFTKDQMLAECKEACVALGDCKQISVSAGSNYCCYFSKSQCSGSKVNTQPKYEVESEICPTAAPTAARRAARAPRAPARPSRPRPAAG